MGQNRPNSFLVRICGLHRGRSERRPPDVTKGGEHRKRTPSVAQNLTLQDHGPIIEATAKLLSLASGFLIGTFLRRPLHLSFSSVTAAPRHHPHSAAGAQRPLLRVGQARDSLVIIDVSRTLRKGFRSQGNSLRRTARSRADILLAHLWLAAIFASDGFVQA